MKFYQKEVATIINELQSHAEIGLSDSESTSRLQKYGKNILPDTAANSAIKILISQFNNIIVLLLLVAVGISLFLADYLEAIAISIVIILNALFGFLTEYKAERTMQALKNLVVTTAKVIRNGKLIEIRAENLVVGDIIVVEEGDQITADARLLSADNLATVEAPLTGEALPVEKNTAPISKDVIPVADMTNTIFMGTTVVRGNGRGVVIATGTETQIGEVSKLLHEVTNEKTPLEKRLDNLGKQLAFFSLGIAVVMIILGLIQGITFFDILKTSLALAIAAVPEGLSAVATIALAIGLTRMAKQKAIIRRLPAVETLGSTTIICTDKTGTLTENQMTLEQIWLGGEEINVTGSGYNPQGNFIYNEANPSISANLQWFLKTGALSSNAALTKNADGNWDIVGDPTEGALIVAALKAGFDVQKERLTGLKEAKEIPFNSDEKRMAVYYAFPDNLYIMAKGAPEVILSSCNHIKINEDIITLDNDWQQKISAENKALSAKGLRVLGLAYKPVTSLEATPFAELVFLGLAGIMDPPRQEAQMAIAEARDAGIRTIMITGDQVATAAAIGERLGLNYGKAVNGQDLINISDQELAKILPQTSIFARVSPQNKLQIVKVLKNSNQIVAMTGDGVNDAPALKEADIGVAMGIQGTEVSKEAADMVLADDNFATIVKAIKEGRKIFSNIQQFIQYLFSCNLSEIFVIFFALVFNLPLPLVAMQILWLNLVTDVFPALSFAWEPSGEDIMNQPPRDPKQDILTKTNRIHILMQGLLLAAGTLGAYIFVLNQYDDIVLARSVAFLTLSLVQVFHAFNIRNHGRLKFNHSLFSNVYLWLAIGLVILLQGLAIYLPLLNKVLHTVPLNIEQLILVLVITLLVMIVIQIYNKLFNFSPHN